MLNISLLFKKFTNFTGNNSWILRIKNGKFSVMYKTRNTGTGNGMRGTGGKGGMLYSRGFRQTFRGMLLNILGNVLKHSGECRQIFRGMLSSIPENVIKHSAECHQIFRGMPPNIPGNVAKYSGECHQKFWGTSPNIPGNVANFWCKGQGCI